MIVILSVLSVVVFTGVFYQLRLTGMSMSGDAFCGLTEHIHSEKCVSKTLDCGLVAVGGHIHSEDNGCFGNEPELICTVSEHTHSDACCETVNVLSCLEEDEEHVHTDACYKEESFLICGNSEHTHSEDCYTEKRVVTCTLEENGHVHTDSCYKISYICGFDADYSHEHSLQCYSNPEADSESEEVWANFFAGLELTGDWNSDLLTIAKTQLGYSESKQNYKVAADGASINGITRYGQWAGKPYEPYNSLFAAWCWNYASLPQDCAPIGKDGNIGIARLVEQGLFRSVSDYSPVPGDIIYIDREQNGMPDFVGIISSEPAEEEGTLVFSVIEADCSEAVTECKYELASPRICGVFDTRLAQKRYCALNEITPPEKSENTEIIEKSVEGENGILEIKLSQKRLEAVVYTDSAYEEQAQADTCIVLTGLLPDGATVKAYPVELEYEGLNIVCAYDITIFLEDGSVFEPVEALEVQYLPIGYTVENEDVYNEIIHFPAEGEPEAVEAILTDKGITFEASHFSVYAWATSSTGVNSANNLRSAVNNAQTSGNTYIRLTSDITINSAQYAMTVRNGSKITLNLNGYKLIVNNGNNQGSTPLFTVPSGGSLTIIDTATDQGQNTGETETDMGAIVAEQAGRLATMTESNNNVTLEYSVVKSEVANESTGETVESRFLRRVTSKGIITGNASYPLFSVTGGTLNIGSGFIYGGRMSDQAIEQSSGTVNLAGGYICGFHQPNQHNENYFGGAVRTAGGTLNISSDAVLAGNQAPSGGAIAVFGGSLNINGGIVSGNRATLNNTTSDECIDYGGGGIFCKSAPVVMTAGYLTDNICASVGYFNGGGGILTNSTTMTMSGGYVTGNRVSGSGGGIRTAHYINDKVYIRGGHVCCNYAETAEGGGVCIDNQGYCEIYTQNIGSRIYINNNATGTQEHWGGGGLFISNGASGFIHSVIVTDNDAGGFGGGVAGCSTGRVVIAIQNGAAVYRNSASGEHLSGTASTKNDDNAYAAKSEIFLQYGYDDYYCALSSTVYGGMLGDYSANWTGSMDGQVVSGSTVGDILTANYIMGLNANPSQVAIAAAERLATGYINGNRSYTHGGGILSNGHVLVGNVVNFDIGDSLQLDADKMLYSNSGDVESIREGAFTFEVVDNMGNIVSEGKTQNDGTIFFNRRLSFSEEGTFIYTIREVDSQSAAYISDTTEFDIAVTVTMEQRTLFQDTGSDVTYFFYRISHLKLTRRNSSGTAVLYDSDVTSDEESSYHYSLPSPTFINYHVDKKNITVKKEWDGSAGGPVTVQLYRNDEVYLTQTLNAQNNWRHTWNDLATTDNHGNSYYYYVKEVVPQGYTASYSTDNTAGSDAFYWVPATTIENGKQYIIVNSSGNRVLSETAAHIDDQFDSTDVANISRQSGNLAIGSTTYNTWYRDSDVTQAMIFTATRHNRQGTVRTLLKNGAYPESGLLVQGGSSESAKGLKGCNNDDYASSIRVYNGKLQGQFEWEPGNGWYYITYASNRFNSSNSQNNSVSIYTRVAASITQSTTVTITNTPVANAKFSLEITKQDASDSNIKLPDATFKLFDSQGNPVEFTGGNGIYSMASSASSRLTVAGYSSNGISPWNNEGLANLFDGKYVQGNWTKFAGSVSGNNNNRRVTVYFNFNAPKKLQSYTLVTGNDNGSNRNPNSWVLYGSNTNNSGWQEIARVNNPGMSAAYFASYSYPVNNAPAYQYYRIVFNTPSSFQLCEMLLYGGDNVTDLITVANGRLILRELSAGEYILHEEYAPDGYATAEDVPISLGTGEGLTRHLIVEDAPFQDFVLPNTGGNVLLLYTVGGLLAVISAVLLLHKKKKCRKGVCFN